MHPHHGFARCVRSTAYSVEQYVNQDTIADYGVRNVIIGQSRICCSEQPCDNPEGGCASLDQCFED